MSINDLKVEYLSDTNNSDADDETDTESETETEFKIDEKKMIPINNALTLDDINNIAFEKINDKYFYGKYGTFKVIMDKKGYINVTRMCTDYNNLHKNRAKKEFRSWKRLDSSKNFLEYMSDVLKMSEDEMLVVNISGKDKETYGTYIHPELVLKVAMWLSDKFYRFVNKLVIKHFSDEMLSIKENIISKQRIKLEEKDDKISELNELIKSMKRDNTSRFNDFEKSHKRIEDNTKKIINQNKGLQKTIKTISKDRVIPTENDGDRNCLILIKNNSRDRHDYEYKVLRIMKSSVNSSLKKHKSKFPKMKKILEIECSPNAVVLWKNIKNKLTKRGNIKCESTSFDLEEDYDEEELLLDINEEHRRRLDTDNV